MVMCFVLFVSPLCAYPTQKNSLATIEKHEWKSGLRLSVYKDKSVTLISFSDKKYIRIQFGISVLKYEHMPGLKRTYKHIFTKMNPFHIFGQQPQIFCFDNQNNFVPSWASL